MIVRLCVLSVSAIALLATSALAEERTARPAAFSALVECRKLADVERLACYDRSVEMLEEAERRRDVVIVDRAEIQRTRRSLFGLTLPSLKLFGNDDQDAPQFKEIQTTLARATQSGSQWLFALDDGTRWLQSDSTELARIPKPGMPIRIRKAAMGSFMANIAGQSAIRVRRLN